MRQITTFDSAAHAERFQDYLIARGIKCSVDDVDAGHALWIVDEDRIEEARSELAKFWERPDDPRYLKARHEANAVLKEEAAKRKAARRNVVALSDRWRAPTAANCPLTIGIIAVCVFVYVEMHLMGDQRRLSERLFISTDGTWTAIQQGEVWRLLTPMIMHGGFLHILFNLMWWWDFGVVLESRKGTWWFLGMVTLISLTANVLQFEFGSPWFLGMSGVNFGLFGFLWIKGKLDPEDGFGVSQQIVIYQLIWFAVCWFGLIGRIANWCHAGGLMMGVILAVLSTAWRQGRKRLR
jgi:GlpG protein